MSKLEKIERPESNSFFDLPQQERRRIYAAQHNLAKRCFRDREFLLRDGAMQEHFPETWNVAISPSFFSAKNSKISIKYRDQTVAFMVFDSDRTLLFIADEFRSRRGKIINIIDVVAKKTVASQLEADRKEAEKRRELEELEAKKAVTLKGIDAFPEP